MKSIFKLWCAGQCMIMNQYKTYYLRHCQRINVTKTSYADKCNIIKLQLNISCFAAHFFQIKVKEGGVEKKMHKQQQKMHFFSTPPCKGNYLSSVAKQAKTAFLQGPTMWKSPIKPATFRSKSAALIFAPQDPTQIISTLIRLCQGERGKWGLCEYVIVHTMLAPNPVISWMEQCGKPKWLPLNFGYHDVTRTAPIANVGENLLSIDRTEMGKWNCCCFPLLSQPAKSQW